MCTYVGSVGRFRFGFLVLGCHPAHRGPPILPPLDSFSLLPSAIAGHYVRGMMRETGQGRIRCHGSLSGIIEIGSSHNLSFIRNLKLEMLKISCLKIKR